MYLAKESIEFGYEAADWRDAVRQAGKLLQALLRSPISMQ